MSTVPDNEAPRIERRAPRWMKIVLVASLGLNMVVAGLVVGMVLRGGPPGGAPHMVRPSAMPLTQALSPEERRAIGKAIRQEMRANDARQTRWASFDDMLILLRADVFDAEAFARHLQMQADRGLVRVRTSQTALIRHLEALSVQERQIYADRVEAALEKARQRGAGRP